MSSPEVPSVPVSTTVTRSRGARSRARAASSLRRVAPALAVAGVLAAPAASQAAVTSNSFPVVADAHTVASAPTTNYGSLGSMKVDSSPLTTGYLRFNPQSLNGRVTKATLRLWATVSSNPGFSVRPVASTTWSEKSVTYKTRPTVSGTVLSRSASYGGSRWLSLDVTKAVAGNGPLSFALVAASTPQLMIGAREAGPARTATLVVETTSDSTPAPPAPPVTPPAPPVTPPADTQAPSAPANLQAIGGNSQVGLSWSAPSDNVGVAGYRVYRDGTQVAAPAGTTYTDTGLANGTSYVFSVRAVDAAGNVSASSASAPVTALAPAIPALLGQVRPYDDASPWNTPIAGNIAVLPNSATYVGAIVDNNLPLTSDPDQYALPVYYFNDQTPRRTVTFAGSFSAYDGGDSSRTTPGYGATVSNVPIPADAVQSAGSDGQIVFWDPTTGVEWSFWQFDRTASGYVATNGARYRTTAGSYGRFADGKAGRGGGTPYFAGLIRGWEIAQGHIDHALAFSYSSPASGIVYPATKSDGAGVTGVDAPEGTRFQLDPSLTEADFQAWGLAPEAKVIARAMQRYGMYVIDNGGSSKIYMEDRLTAKWPASITRNLTAKIPLSKFRAVAAPAPPA
jgi:fibronectin type III domain protein